MNCIIIEDEELAVERLEYQLNASGHEINIQTRLPSVKKAVAWLSDNQTDLIFLDIQLGDGLGFEIFDHIQVKTPVIFTTSYDEYISQAFDVNSIAYLLKPIMLNRLKFALDKYDFLAERQIPVSKLIAPLERPYQKRFLVKTGHSLLPLDIDNIAYFYLQNARFLFIVTKDKQQYLYDSTVEILEQRLDPELFFRVNRQCIMHYSAIKELKTHDKSRIAIQAEPESKEEIWVSTNRTAAFRNWLNR